jgi:hypothetical protein
MTMERRQTTLWPEDGMAISPERYLRQWFAFPVALVKRLYAIHGKEETLRLVKEAMLDEVECLASSVAYQGWATKKTARTFAEYMQASRNLGSPILTGPLPQGATLVWKTTRMDASSYKVTDSSFSFNITRCLWSEIFRELDAAEVGRAWICESDFPRAKTMHPKLELRREQTIMEGASHCDFSYVWND